MIQQSKPPNELLQDHQPSNQGVYSAMMQDEKTINWRKYLFLLLRNWYWFLIAFGVALGIAFFKLRYTIPIYQASATLILQDGGDGQSVLNELRAVRYFRRQADLANEKAKINSFSTVKRTVDSLDQDIFWTAHGRVRLRPLYNSPSFKLTLLNDSLEWIKGKQWFVDYIDDNNYHFYRDEFIDTILPLDSEILINDCRFSISLLKKGAHETYSFVVNNPIALTKKYRQKLKLETRIEESSVITLLSEGTVGEREVDFLNTLCNIYIRSELERKQTIAENTFIFIDEQIDVILDSLNQAEQQLLTYRLSNNVINLSRDGEIAYERLRSYHEQRTQLKMKENYYAYLKNYIEERNDPQTIIAPTVMGTQDQLLIAAVTELQGYYEQRESLDYSVMQNNPGLDIFNERIKSTRLRILEIIKGLIENNKLTIRQIETEEEAIINQLKTLPLSEQQLLNITRKYDLYNQFYTYLLQKRAEAGIQKASAVSNARVLDQARYDQLTPVGTNRTTIILIAIALSLLIPASIVILIDLLDFRIRERSDIEDNTNIPIIGTIGHSVESGALPVLKDPQSSLTETLRRIRTNLSFALRDKEKKIIMVTSCVSGEGKTFTAANLATIIAINNKKVLLLSCDLRKPALHRVFDCSNAKGITTYIIGDNDLDEIIIHTNIKNLDMIPAGPIPPNPAELIETEKMKILFEFAREKYDYIIIDTPPVGIIADALSLAIYADLTLFLIRQNKSHKHVLQVANTLRDEGKLPNTYLIINDIKPIRSMGLYYYYGYGKDYHSDYYGYESN